MYFSAVATGSYNPIFFFERKWYKQKLTQGHYVLFHPFFIIIPFQLANHFFPKKKKDAQ